jgi:hypothetical protein
MKWLNDRYEFTGADVAAGWAGRGWNWRTHAWETISGKDLDPSEMTPYVLRAMQLWLYTSALIPFWGVTGSLYVVGDSESPGFTVRLPASGLQGGRQTISYVGSYPFAAGCLYRLANPGPWLTAGDFAECTIGYEIGGLHG